MRAQLDHARTLRFTKKEMIWLAGNSSTAAPRSSSRRFLAWLDGFPLPDYELRREDGQFVLDFTGPGARPRCGRSRRSPSSTNCARARRSSTSAASSSTCSMPAPRPSCGPRSSGCAGCPDLRISDFGTRRRHSFLWQRWCVEALKEGLGDAFIGSSNVLLAMNNDLEAIGTNAHELPMVLGRAGARRRGAAQRALSRAARTGRTIMAATC